MRAFLVFVLVLLPSFAGAQSWPVYENIYVNDYAEVLSEATEERITRQLKSVGEEIGVQATVLTLPTRRGFTPSDNMEDFATGLFNHWGIGDASRNDGILIMVLVNDREMRIELGSGYGRAFNREAQDIIDRVFLPSFREGDYSEGIEAGTDAVLTRIARVHHAGDEPTEWDDGGSSSSGGDPIGRVFVVFAIMFGTLAAFSRKIRDKFARCPECRKRGIHTRRKRLVSPTRSSTGTGEKTVDCPHCGFHRVSSYTIPKVSSSSSSSGGSFGGGSSSGGGASGRW